jgi:hypothetical protein
MNLIMIRDTSTPNETLYKLQVGEQVFDAIGQPDNHDQPDHSCIPLGLYQLVPHDTAAHPDTWAMVNPALGVTHEPADPIPDDCTYPHRFACLLHPANFAHQLQGCFAPGMGRSLAGGMWMVTDSRMAFTAIQEMLEPGTTGHTLEIKETA